jgi:hypothetical protein
MKFLVLVFALFAAVNVISSKRFHRRSGDKGQYGQICKQTLLINDCDKGLACTNILEGKFVCRRIEGEICDPTRTQCTTGLVCNQGSKPGLGLCVKVKKARIFNELFD